MDKGTLLLIENRFLSKKYLKLLIIDGEALKQLIGSTQIYCVPFICTNTLFTFM